MHPGTRSTRSCRHDEFARIEETLWMHTNQATRVHRDALISAANSQLNVAHEPRHCCVILVSLRNLCDEGSRSTTYVFTYKHRLPMKLKYKVLFIPWTKNLYIAERRNSRVVNFYLFIFSQTWTTTVGKQGNSIKDSGLSAIVHSHGEQSNRD